MKIVRLEFHLKHQRTILFTKWRINYIAFSGNLFGEKYHFATLKYYMNYVRSSWWVSVRCRAKAKALEFHKFQISYSTRSTDKSNICRNFLYFLAFTDISSVRDTNSARKLKCSNKLSLNFLAIFGSCRRLWAFAKAVFNQSGMRQKIKQSKKFMADVRRCRVDSSREFKNKFWLSNLLLQHDVSGKFCRALPFPINIKKSSPSIDKISRRNLWKKLWLLNGKNHTSRRQWP